MNDISTKMQRGIFLPKGSPPEAVEAMRRASPRVAKDPDFIADYKKITGEEPDLVKAERGRAAVRAHAPHRPADEADPEGVDRDGMIGASIMRRTPERQA